MSALDALLKWAAEDREADHNYPRAISGAPLMRRRYRDLLAVCRAGRERLCHVRPYAGELVVKKTAQPLMNRSFAV